MPRRLSSQRRSLRQKSRNARRLHVERLEDRHLLATLTVNWIADNVTPDSGNFSLTLREAMLLSSGNLNRCITTAEMGQITGATFVAVPPNPGCLYNPAAETRWNVTSGLGSGSADLILFQSDVAMITPGSQLPTLSFRDEINGDLGSGNKVTLNGASAGLVNGLKIESGSGSDPAFASTIRNLIITSFQGSGITGDKVVLAKFQGLEIHNNGLNGIEIRGTTDGVWNPHDNLIGGAIASERNFIFDNGADGILIQRNPDVPFDAHSNTIQNNFIGLNPSGVAKPNGQHGVHFMDVRESTILNNTIGANDGDGIQLEGSGSISNNVQSNFIGIGTAGEERGNTLSGIALLANANSNTIQNNVIAHNDLGIYVQASSNLIQNNTIVLNDRDGVYVDSGTGNRILSNGFSGNGGLGIDLAPDGVNANDSGDGDGGSNNRQNVPTLTKANPSGTSTVIEGSLNSTASTSFQIQFFHSGECDPSGRGEGQEFIGEVVQSTDGSGNLSFNPTFATTVPTGQFVTATATNTATGDTSEFSACRAVTPSSGAGMTLTWTGANSDKWNDSKNWRDDLFNDALPIGGERLVFPAVAQNFNPLNNLNLVDPTFESITILGSGYVISGSTITVGTISSADTTTNTLTLGIKPGAFFHVAGKAQLVFGGVMSGAGSVGLMKQGTGELVIDGFNTYAGQTIISAGTLAMDDGGRIPDASAVSVFSGALFDLNGFSETIGSLSGGGNVHLDGGALDTGLNGDSTTFSGIITGVGDFDKSGAGTLTLSGQNNYDGATHIKLGNIQLGTNEVIPNGSDLTIEPGAALVIGDFSETVGSLDGGGSVSGNGNFAAGGNGASTSFTGNMGGFGQFFKFGTGTMDVSGSLAKIVNNINGGSLRLQANNVLGGGPLQINGGTLDLNGFNQTVFNALNMSGGGIIETGVGLLTLATGITTSSNSLQQIRGNLSLGGATRTINAGGPLQIFATISDGGGSAGLTKIGGGFLSLDGNKSYTGATNVQAGTLNLRGNIASSAVTVSTGSLLETFLEHTTGALTLDGGTVQPGFTDRLNTQSLVLNSGTLALDFESAATFGYDDLSVTGGVTLNDLTTLNLALDFNPQDNVDVFRIIRNDGSDPTVLNGAGARFVYQGNVLEEGEIFHVTTGAFSQFFEIRYGLTAGDNDVRLIALSADFGDAPSPYPTTLAQNGARHANLGPRLGANRDGENNGQPNATATGDDVAGAPDDEDGVVFGANLVVGQTGRVTVTASAAGQLNAWIDFNNNGSWADAGEQIFTNRAVVTGANNLTFAIPGSAAVGVNRPARFRLSTAGGLSFTGPAIDGEVEDHLVNFQLPTSDKIGIHREYHFYQDVNGNGVWNSNAGGDRLNSFGATGDVPVVGDWNGDGFDEIGVKRSNQYYLDLNGNGIWNAPAGGDVLYSFGNPSDIPLVGDWDGDGDDQIGVQRGNQFYLDFNSNGTWNGVAGGDVLYSFGNSGDTPLAGDWDGDGDDQIGVHRGSSFYLDRNSNGVWNTAAGGDRLFNFGAAGDVPIVGDWNANGTDDIGVQRGNQFYRDNNGNGIWNGPAGGDLLHTFGNPGDRPLDGRWRPGAPLLAAGGAKASSSDCPTVLTREALAPIQQQALLLWANTGLTPAQTKSLAAVQFQIADLPGAQLGLALGGTIVLDFNAAGYGWFIDPTPADDFEFDPSALPTSAFDVPHSMDLLSAVLHELGHELGLDHDDDIDAMIETLASGTRRLV